MVSCPSVSARSRVVVVPDVHGDLEKARRILFACGVVDARGDWVGRDTLLVQMGDQLDGASRRGGEVWEGTHRCGAATARDVAVVRYFSDLRRQAAGGGGECVCLAGNHEVMNAQGIFTYAGLAGCERCARERARLFLPGGELAAEIGATRACVVRAGPTLFSHAGVLPEHVQHARGDLGWYNDALRELMLDPRSPRSDAISGALIGGPRALLSHRQYHPEFITDASVAGAREVLRACGAARMVVAHNTTPGLVMTYGHADELVVFDPGMSRAVADAVPMALQIRGGDLQLFVE